MRYEVQTHIRKIAMVFAVMPRNRKADLARALKEWDGIFPEALPNTLKNMKSKLSRTISMYGTWQGCDVLVVGAGKSAIDNLDVIAKWPGKIVCVDRIFSEIKKRGRTPDLCVSLDCRAPESFFDGADERDTFALAIHQSAELIESLALKSRVTLYSPINVKSKPGKIAIKNPVATGACVAAYPTVGCTAAEMAAFLEPRMIALVGLDGYYETKEETGVDDDSLIFTLHGMDGVDRYTIPPFIIQMEWFDEFPTMYPHIHWVDCTQGLLHGYNAKLNNGYKVQTNIKEMCELMIEIEESSRQKTA